MLDTFEFTMEMAELDAVEEGRLSRKIAKNKAKKTAARVTPQINAELDHPDITNSAHHSMNYPATVKPVNFNGGKRSSFNPSPRSRGGAVVPRGTSTATAATRRSGGAAATAGGGHTNAQSGWDINHSRFKGASGKKVPRPNAAGGRSEIYAGRGTGGATSRSTTQWPSTPKKVGRSKKKSWWGRRTGAQKAAIGAAAGIGVGLGAKYLYDKYHNGGHPFHDDKMYF